MSAVKKKAKESKRKRAQKAKPKGRDGRPQNWERRVLAAHHHMLGESDSEIAAVVGVARETVWDWRHHPTWPDALNLARDRWHQDTEFAARRAVHNSIKRGNAALGWEFLQRVDNKLMPKSRTELTGANGGPVKTEETGPKLDDLDNKQLANLASKLAAELAKG